MQQRVWWRCILCLLPYKEAGRLENDRIAAVLDNIGDGVIATDMEGRIEYMNNTAATMTGWAAEEAVCQEFSSVFSLINIKSGESVDSPIKEVMSRKAVVGLKNNSALLSREGKTYILSASCSPIRDKNHNFSGVVVVFRDISKIKRMEENLIEERNNLEMTFNHSPLGMLIMDCNRVVRQVNNAFLEMLGISDDQVLGLGYGDGIGCVFSREKGCGNSSDCGLCEIRNRISAVFKTGIPSKDLVIQQTTLRGGVRKRPWYNILFMPVHHSGERSVLLVITNVSESMEREQKLIEANNFSLKMMENFPALIWKTDNTGRNVYANHNFLTFVGKSEQEVISEGWLDCVHPDDREKLEVKVFEQIDEKWMHNTELRLKHSSGNYIWLNTVIKPFYDITGKQDGYIGMGLDIDDKKNTEMQLQRAKEEAEKANRSKSEFLANMSHEIRTPINGIVGMIELTLLTRLDSEQKDNLLTAKSCANSLLKIINDILDFSKMEAGKLVIDNVDFDIRLLIEEIFKAQSTHADRKGLEFNYTFYSGIPQYLLGDPGRLQQILNNLVSNAIKFTEKGEVNIVVRKELVEADKVELKFSVSDTGIGISDEDKEKLFKTFSQVDSSITRKYGGNGLGLVISRQLVEMMGGRMWIESEKGKGSTFNFTVGFNKGRMTVSGPDRQQTAVKTAGKLKILLAEDDNVNKAVITRMLKERGHEVDVAGTGVEAVGLFSEKGNYDLILMDIHMPVMDGLEATKIIREKEGGERHTPVIALTAHALQGDRERFMELGMDEYIPKPVGMKELYSIIEAAVSGLRPHKDIKSIRIDMEGNVVLQQEAGTEGKSERVAPSLVERIEKVISSLAAALEGRDMELAGNLAHDIKNICNEMGADELKSLAFQIELAVRRNNFRDVLYNFLTFDKEFKTLKSLYSRRKEQ